MLGKNETQTLYVISEVILNLSDILQGDYKYIINGLHFFSFVRLSGLNVYIQRMSNIPS